MILLPDGIANSVKPAREDLSQVMSLKTILSDWAKTFVEISRTKKKLKVAEIFVANVTYCRWLGIHLTSSPATEIQCNY